MKRTTISLEDIAEYQNLSLALYKAAKGKRQRRPVADFLCDAEGKLNRLAGDIRRGVMPYGRFRAFTIHDPKKRLIHAACFEDRIFHHALINLAGPVLERAMHPTSFACRPAMGVHLAASLVQRNIRRYSWYGKIDIAAYFAKIDHQAAMSVLLRRFKGEAFEGQLWRVVDGYHCSPGKGLPIGSLTSQYFANYYLDSLDRLLNDHLAVRGHVRYMDDIVWWCDDKRQVNRVLHDVRDYLYQQRGLEIKPNEQVQRSRQGISYCGYRILPGTIRLSARRKRRYQQRRIYWEQCYRLGAITAQQLQTAYAAVHAVTHGTDSRGWRQKNLCLHPPLTV